MRLNLLYLEYSNESFLMNFYKEEKTHIFKYIASNFLDLE